MDEPTKTYIAIIEDDAGLRSSLARLLRAAGYHPVTYQSAEGFLSDAKRPVFDCLVVDIQLNGMAGIELSERLAAQGSITPLVLLSADEDREVLQRTVRAPFAGFIGKSAPCAAVFAAIDSAIHIGGKDAGIHTQ